MAIKVKTFCGITRSLDHRISGSSCAHFESILLPLKTDLMNGKKRREGVAYRLTPGELLVS